MTEKLLRILLVEDEPVNLQVLDLMLQSLGHEVVTATCGPQALAAIGTQDFDLVMSDLHMPGMDGERLLAEIRALGDPAPMVAVTADVMSHPPEHYLAEGFAGFLSKPLLMPALIQCLARFSAGLPAIAGRLPLHRARCPIN